MRPAARSLFLLLAAALGALPASAGMRSPDGRLSYEVPDGWIQETDPPALGEPQAMVNLKAPLRFPIATFKLSSLGGAMSEEGLKAAAAAKGKTLEQWGAGQIELRDWSSPSGLRMAYFETDSPDGELFEGALGGPGVSYWVKARSLPEPEFLELAGLLRPSAAAPMPPQQVLNGLRAELQAPASGEPLNSVEGGAQDAPRIAIVGGAFSIAPPAGYLRRQGEAAESVLAMEGPGRLELYRATHFPPSRRLLYHLAGRLWPLFDAGAPIDRQEDGGPDSALKGPAWRGWAQVGRRGAWSLAEFQHLGEKYWLVVTGDANKDRIVRELIASVGPPEAAPGLPYPAAIEPEPWQGKTPDWAWIPAGALVLVALWYLLFGMAKSDKAPPWADSYEIPDMMSTNEPWNAHPLAGDAAVVDLGGFFQRKIAVMRDGRAVYSMRWRRPGKVIAFFGGGVTFFAVLAGAPPLGPGLAGAALQPVLAGLGSALALFLFAPRGRLCCQIFNADGRQIGLIERRGHSGLPAETYRIEGLDGSMFGYICRGMTAPLFRKKWMVLDYGGQLLLTASENPLRSAVRRVTGRLAGLTGARLDFWEDGVRSGQLRSTGLLRRKLKVKFDPNPSRALVLLDPLVLLALCAIVLAQDPDAQTPWPFA